MPETEEKKPEERKGGDRPAREGRGSAGGGPRAENRPPGGDRGRGPGGDRGGPAGDRDRDRGRGPAGAGDRRGEGPPEMDLEKLIADPLYLDNQAHVVVSRMRDMDSGTKSQLRRLYNAVRRATRAPESERQHEFVMVRARLAYTIARHSLRSLDALERLLLQVTRKNDTRGYERFRDLFEAIIAYNE
jgi:CRISPR type III-A-associated protein Csm2